MRRRVPKESTSHLSPPGVEPVLSSWKVGVVTASPPSSIFLKIFSSVLLTETNTTKNEHMFKSFYEYGICDR